MFGYVPDSPDATDPDVEDILDSSDPVEAVCYSHLLDKVLEQEGNSCTSFAVNQAAYLVERVANPHVQPERLNLLQPYWDGREDTRVDQGAAPRRVMRAYWAMGYTRESDWPFCKDRLFTPPPARLRFQSFPQVGKLGYFRCDDGGGEMRAWQLKRGLTAGKIPVTSLAIDDGFMRYQGGIWTRQGPERGLHYVCVVGYDADGPWIVNSWGEDKGVADPHHKFKGGFYHIGWETIEDPDYCRDTYLISQVPEML